MTFENAELEGLADDLLQLSLEAVSEALEDVHGLAIVLSSGPKSSAQLAREGHPYATRNPTSTEPELINIQTGAFRSAWQSGGPAFGPGGNIEASETNSDPVADWLIGGTALMVVRPIDVALEEFAQKALDRRVDAKMKRL